MDVIRVASGGDANEGLALELSGVLRGTVSQSGSFAVQKIVVQVWAPTAARRDLVVAFPPAEIELSARLFKGPGPYELRTAEELGQLDTVTKSLRDEALRRLRSIELAWHQVSTLEGETGTSRNFLGVTAFGNARTTGRAVINLLTILTPEEQTAYGRFAAEISLQVEFDAKLNLGGGNVATLRRGCALHIQVGTSISIGLNLDELNLSLPEMPLTLRELAELNLLTGAKVSIKTALDGVSGVFARLAKYSGDDWKQLRVRYSWGGATPVLMLRWVVASNQLQFAVAKDGFTMADFDAMPAVMEPKLAKFSADLLVGSEVAPLAVAKVTNGLAASGSQAKFFQANVQIFHNPPDIPEG